MQTPTGERVEGTTIFETLREPWFRCRITVSPSPEGNDAQAGRMRTPKPAQMMCALHDQDGNLLDIRSADRLEVISNQLGRAVFELTTDGEPIRKKRKMLGWMASITRVEEHPFEEAEP